MKNLTKRKNHFNKESAEQFEGRVQQHSFDGGWE